MAMALISRRALKQSQSLAIFASDSGLTDESDEMQKKVREMDSQFSANLFVRSHGLKMQSSVKDCSMY